MSTPDRGAREERCPDGGYCHGSRLDAGSPPCAEDACYRVLHAGPLSGVYPEDRWPDLTVARALRVQADSMAPRVLPGDRINTQHVAIEQTLRQRRALPSYFPELDGPGNFRPRITDSEGA